MARAEYRPDQLTEADAHFYLSQKIFYPVGPDKDGRPGTYVHGKMHVADVDRIEEMVKVREVSREGGREGGPAAG